MSWLRRSRTELPPGLLTTVVERDVALARTLPAELHERLIDLTNEFIDAVSWEGANGFTVTALQAAWAAITSTDPGRGDGSDRGAGNAAAHLRRALSAAVHAGDDTDTVAAIAGGLLGARYGASAVPDAWSSLVHGWPGMTATDLTDLATRTATRG